MDTAPVIVPEPITPPPVAPIPQPAGIIPVGLIAIFAFILGVASVIAYQKYLPTGSNPVGASPSPVAALPSPSTNPTTSKFTDSATTNLPDGWTYINNSECNIQLPLPPKNPDADNRTWQIETNTNYGFLGFFKGKGVNAIHRNPTEASGFISGLVEIACGSNSKAETLTKMNSDFHAYLTTQASQATIPEAVIELTANNDVTMWGMPAKEMTFVGWMFDPKQKYYLIVNPDKWYVITKKSDSSNSVINQQTDQIFNLLKFNQ